MDNQIQSFKSLINSSNNILLLFPYIINSDISASISLVAKYIASQGKNITLGSSRPIPERFHSILKLSNIDPEKIINTIKPVSYIVSVNDAQDKVDVTWEKSESKIKFVLTPENSEIDFSKISFAREGGVYDLLITFSANRLEDLGEIYSNSQKQYSRYDIVSLNYQNTSKPDYSKLNLDESNLSTLSELTYELLQKIGYQIDNSDAKILAEGILGSTYGLHQASNSRTYTVISELINKFNIDAAEINTKYFYSLTKKDLKFREKLLQNVKYIDTKSLIYSTLSDQEFKDLELSPSQLDGIDYLPFNVCKGYDLAFFAYEYKNKTTVLIHSNNNKKNLTQLLEKLNGIGNNLYGVAEFQGNVDAAVQRITSALNSVNENSDSFDQNTQENLSVNEEIPQISELNLEPMETSKESSINEDKRYEVNEVPKSSYFVEDENQSENILDKDELILDDKNEISDQSARTNSNSSDNLSNYPQTAKDNLIREELTSESDPQTEVQPSPFQKASSPQIDENYTDYPRSQSGQNPFQKA